MTAFKKNKVLLVDDHPIVREGLRGLLGQLPDIVVSGEADGIASALTHIRESQPNAAVIDIALGKESGLDLIRMSRAERQTLVMLAHSMHDERIYAERALRNGANGYIMKQEAPLQLVGALRTVLEGKTFVSPAVTERMLSAM